MFGIFKSDPVEKARKAYHAKLTEAMNAQRNGKIREYSFITMEADALKSKLDILEKNESDTE